jgi:hypothetical protein
VLDHVDAAPDVLRHRRADVAVHDATEVVAVPARGGQRWPRRDDAWQARTFPEADGAEAPVPQVPDRGHSRQHVRTERVRDHVVDRLAGHRCSPLQTSEGRVRNEVAVAVDQSRQHGAGVFHDGHTVRQIGPSGLHPDDPVPGDQHRRAVGMEPGPVEHVRPTDGADAATVACRARPRVRRS